MWSLQWLFHWFYVKDSRILYFKTSNPVFKHTCAADLSYRESILLVYISHKGCRLVDTTQCVFGTMSIALDPPYPLGTDVGYNIKYVTTRRISSSNVFISVHDNRWRTRPTSDPSATPGLLCQSMRRLWSPFLSGVILRVTLHILLELLCCDLSHVCCLYFAPFAYPSNVVPCFRICAVSVAPGSIRRAGPIYLFKISTVTAPRAPRYITTFKLLYPVPVPGSSSASVMQNCCPFTLGAILTDNYVESYKSILIHNHIIFITCLIYAYLGNALSSILLHLRLPLLCWLYNPTNQNEYYVPLFSLIDSPLFILILRGTNNRSLYRIKVDLVSVHQSIIISLLESLGTYLEVSVCYHVFPDPEIHGSTTL